MLDVFHVSLQTFFTSLSTLPVWEDYHEGLHRWSAPSEFHLGLANGSQRQEKDKGLKELAPLGQQLHPPPPTFPFPTPGTAYSNSYSSLWVPVADSLLTPSRSRYYQLPAGASPWVWYHLCWFSLNLPKPFKQCLHQTLLNLPFWICHLFPARTLSFKTS